jgi:hypothetical protein
MTFKNISFAIGGLGFVQAWGMIIMPAGKSSSPLTWSPAPAWGGCWEIPRMAKHKQRLRKTFPNRGLFFTSASCPLFKVSKYARSDQK